jgi:hypothetical protein
VDNQAPGAEALAQPWRDPDTATTRDVGVPLAKALRFLMHASAPTHVPLCLGCCMQGSEPAPHGHTHHMPPIFPYLIRTSDVVFLFILSSQSLYLLQLSAAHKIL